MRDSRTIHFLVILLLLLCASGCNFRPQVLKDLFATSTPTPTNTPPATATPRPTATFTPTPRPAVNLEPCAFARDCPETISIFEFIDEDVYPGQEYAVDVPFDVPIGFHVGWTTKDDAALAENIQHIHFRFKIDGQDYYDDRFTSQDLSYFADDPDTGYPAIFFGVTTTGWKVGQAHRIDIGFEFDDEVFDGWDTFSAGTNYYYTYVIMPVLKPTDTPTPESTATKTPAPRPTAVPATATPACERNASISIKNDTGGFVTIYLKGPASFTFNVAAGNQSISVCPGTYSYTAYGCGGSSRTGSVSNGDEIEFWCQ